jgi:hypothetical protein
MVPAVQNQQGTVSGTSNEGYQAGTEPGPYSSPIPTPDTPQAPTQSPD